MKFRPAYSFFNAFLEMPRQEREELCTQALLKTISGADKTELDEISAGISANPEDEATQKALLGRLYLLWNTILSRLEEEWPTQTPALPISLGEKTIVAVIGGKFVEKGLMGMGDELVHLLLEHSPQLKVCRSPQPLFTLHGHTVPG